MCSRPINRSLDNRTQKEIVTLLGKMVRAALTSSPLYEIEFFADYLDAELNRRTLNQLQKFGESECGSKSFETDDQNNFQSLLKDRNMQKSRHRDGCASKYRPKHDSRCIAVQTDKNHLQYQTRSPFLQKMEAELISSVIENLNNTNHECLCNCAPPPLFWYHITRPQVVRSCRKSKIKLTKKTLQESVVKTSDGSDTVEEVLMINASPETGHEKMTGSNDAGLARIIDREMKSTSEMKTSERPVNPPPTEISLKIDASTQVETIVCKSKIKLPEKEIPPAEVEVSHKYVQTMDLDIFRPETEAHYEQPDKPSDKPDEPSDKPSVDEPATAPNVDTVDCEVVAAVDWSQFTQVPISCHSSTDWLNIEVDGGEPDYDTEWSELTNSQAFCREESVFNWLLADIVSEADKCVKSQDDDFDLTSIQPPEDSHDYYDEGDDLASIQPKEDFHDYYDVDNNDLASIQPKEDFHDYYDGDDLDIASAYSHADWTDGEVMPPESPAHMMTPDMEDVMVGCEEPSLFLDSDMVDEMQVLQWNPIVVEPEPLDAESYHIPTPVPQCSDTEEEKPVISSCPAENKPTKKEPEPESPATLSNASLCSAESDQNRTGNDPSTKMLTEVPPSDNDQTTTENDQEVSPPSPSNENLGPSDNDQTTTENDQSTEMLKEVSPSNENLGPFDNDHDRTELLKEVSPPSLSNANLDPSANDQNITEDDHTPENEMLKQVFGDDLLTSSGQEIDKTHSRGKNPNILPRNKEHSSDEESAEQIINSEEINEHLKSASRDLTDVSTTAENSDTKDS